MYTYRFEKSRDFVEWLELSKLLPRLCVRMRLELCHCRGIGAGPGRGDLSEASNTSSKSRCKTTTLLSIAFFRLSRIRSPFLAPLLKRASGTSTFIDTSSTINKLKERHRFSVNLTSA